MLRATTANADANRAASCIFSISERHSLPENEKRGNKHGDYRAARLAMFLPKAHPIQAQLEQPLALMSISFRSRRRAALLAWAAMFNALVPIFPTYPPHPPPCLSFLPSFVLLA